MNRHRPRLKTIQPAAAAARTLVHLTVLIGSDVRACPPVLETFAAGANDWSTIDGASPVEWMPAEGNPGGAIGGSDAIAGPVWQFVSGPSLGGNFAPYLGAELRWDIETSSVVAPESGIPDVTIVSAVATLVAAVDPPARAGAWVTRTVCLCAGPWHVGTLDGPIASTEDVLAVLTTLDHMLIRGEFDGDSAIDSAMLDNVMIVPVSGAPTDLDGDGVTEGGDLAIVLASWGACGGCAADFDCNGIVDGPDLAELLGAWGAP